MDVEMFECTQSESSSESTNMGCSPVSISISSFQLQCISQNKEYGNTKDWKLWFEFCENGIGWKSCL